MPAQPSARRSWNFGHVLLPALAGAALIACGSGEEGVLVGTVERTLVELDAPTSETLVDVRVRRGQGVRRGAVLARLDPTLVEADVANAEATLAGARTALVIGESDLTRLTRLHASRVASDQDLERARLTRDEAAARLREAEARLTAVRHRLEEMTITSPVDGVVDQIPFDPGERVPAGGVVVVVLDAAAPWVRVWVPAPMVASVQPGIPADVHVDGVAPPLHGHVLDVAHEPEFTPHFALTERDRVHLVYETRVAIDDAPAGLRPGVPAQVRFSPSARSGA